VSDGSACLPAGRELFFLVLKGKKKSGSTCLSAGRNSTTAFFGEKVALNGNILATFFTKNGGTPKL